MKRIAIYVYHDKNGKIEDYAVYFIKSLLEVANEIIVAINGNIEQDEIKKINQDRVIVLQRENIGYDFWAYRKGLINIGLEKIKRFDELIFANSSTYGPLFPFFEVFNKMSLKDVDFWGLTKHPEINKNVIKFNPKTKIKEHIQSYFMVFRKSVFLNPEFRKYFENLKKIKNKKEAIGHIEVSLTEHFKKLGFKYDTFVGDDILKYEVNNYHQYLPDITTIEYHCPLIKKTIFGTRYDLHQKESLGERTKKLFNYIKENTNYDINLITKDIIKHYEQSEIKSFLKLNFILSKNYRENFQTARCACVTNSNEIKEYLKNLYGFIDAFREYDPEKLKNYEYILFFNPDVKNLPPVVRSEYIKHSIECSVSNKTYVTNVIDTFSKNPYIGILTPAPFVFNNFKLNKNNFNKDDIKEFFEKTNTTVEYNLNYLNTLSDVFWIKKETLDLIEIPKFETNLAPVVIFSLLAQKEGFLTGTISSPEVAEKYITDLEYTVLNRNKFLSEIAFKLNKITGKKQ